MTEIILRKNLREELTLEGWVSGVTNDEGAENCSDT